MNDWSDQQLLREYATQGSQEAFGILVRRHLDWIHSAAVRMVLDRQLAEDVTQGVLIALSRHAMELSDRAVVAGWLHRTTRNLAAKAVRTEVRRRSREQEAARWHGTEDPMAWDELAPQLDEALDQLGETDRDVLALRFLERRSAREIGAAMKLSEEAAQKRVSRAVERLRAIFVERGLAVPTSTLVTAMLLNAVQAAPATLGATLFSGNFAGATASSFVGFTAGYFMTSSALKTGIIGLVVVGLATTVGVQRRQNLRLQSELEGLKAEVAASAIELTPEPVAPSAVAPSEELLRLRSEVGRLRSTQSDFARLQAENQRLKAEIRSKLPDGKPISGEEFLAANALQEGVYQTTSGLQYKILASGVGRSPKTNEFVKVHYHGTLIDGTVFDSSVERGTPAKFPVGAVIPGWTEALQLMKEGDKWQLYIPAKLAYGEKGAGKAIAPNSVLQFEVELLAVDPTNDP